MPQRCCCCAGGHSRALLSCGIGDTVQQQRDVTRCAVMRAALVVLLSVCEHPAARQWVAIMPETVSLARNLQHLSNETPERQLLREAGYTLEAMISGHFSVQPPDRPEQHLNSSSWYKAGQKSQQDPTCDGQHTSPGASPGASTAVECFPISPTCLLYTSPSPRD